MGKQKLFIPKLPMVRDGLPPQDIFFFPKISTSPSGSCCYALSYAHESGILHAVSETGAWIGNIEAMHRVSEDDMEKTVTYKAMLYSAVYGDGLSLAMDGLTSVESVVRYLWLKWAENGSKGGHGLTVRRVSSSLFCAGMCCNGSKEEYFFDRNGVMLGSWGAVNGTVGSLMSTEMVSNWGDRERVKIRTGFDGMVRLLSELVSRGRVSSGALVLGNYPLPDKTAVVDAWYHEERGVSKVSIEFEKPAEKTDIWKI